MLQCTVSKSSRRKLRAWGERVLGLSGLGLESGVWGVGLAGDRSQAPWYKRCLMLMIEFRDPGSGFRDSHIC